MTGRQRLGLQRSALRVDNARLSIELDLLKQVIDRAVRVLCERTPPGEHWSAKNGHEHQQKNLDLDPELASSAHPLRGCRGLRARRVRGQCIHSSRPILSACPPLALSAEEKHEFCRLVEQRAHYENSHQITAISGTSTVRRVLIP